MQFYTCVKETQPIQINVYFVVRTYVKSDKRNTLLEYMYKCMYYKDTSYLELMRSKPTCDN